MRNIYAILDKVAQEITGLRMYCLMVFRTDTEAARYFADAINDTSSILNKHPQDYDLIHCGTVSDDGRVEAFIGSPTLVANGATLLAVQQPAETPK